VARYGKGTVTINVSPSTGFTGTVALSVTGLPAGATAAFAPASVPTSGSSVLTVSAGSAKRGSYTLNVKGSSGSLTKTTTLSLRVTR
jgi:hypothetical protein